MSDPDSWWLDEVAHAGREHFDEQHARRYDAKMDAGADAVDVSPVDATYSASRMLARYLCRKR